MTTTAKHETRALLRAHLAAASGYRHFTRHCPVCHRLLRLAMEPAPRAEQAPAEQAPAGPPAGPSTGEAPPAEPDGSSTR
ncbi:DUF6274 family protein [Streptomyces botrytidirepellens]|uniref:DUF6274 family protein n=1 Tax=Streptomyces botrytidirepellens TaxID=2486417 RepID=UPI00161B9ACE|nr:DUF6274 family protein [Streptomyces botrytidirepellens]